LSPDKITHWLPLTGIKGSFLHFRHKIWPYFSILGLYLIRGWLLLAKRRFEFVTGIHLTAKVTTTSLFSAAVLPMAYTAAYQQVPPVSAPPVIEASTVTTWAKDPIAPKIGAIPSAPLTPTKIAHPPGTWRNGYAYGNCTYYVAAKRSVPRGWGHARTWKPRAEASGYKTGNVAAVGAIAWTPFGRYGHVAYVEAVNGNQVTISEMNYVRWNRVNTRTVPAGSFQYIY
jgi:surface antigen